MAGQSANRRSKQEFRGTGLYVSFVLALVLAVLILIGIIQNTQSVTLSYLVWKISTPLIVILLATIVASVIISALVGVIWRRRRRRELTEREELRLRRGSGVEPVTPIAESVHPDDASPQAARPRDIQPILADPTTSTDRDA